MTDETGSPNSARACLKAGLALYCLGAGAAGLKYTGPVFSYLFISREWPEAEALRVEHGAAGLLLLCAPLVFWSRAWPALAFVSLWSAARAAAQVWDDVWHPELIPLSHGLRILAPWALFLAAFREQGRAAWGLLRAAVAATFLGHGLEAWLGRGEFVDMIILSGAKVFGLTIGEPQALLLLRAIGIADAAVAAAMLLPGRWRAVALWATAWGLITAAARVVSLGAWNYPETLTRLLHAAAPLALFLVWKGVEAARDRRDSLTFPRLRSPSPIRPRLFHAGGPS